MAELIKTEDIDVRIDLAIQQRFNTIHNGSHGVVLTPDEYDFINMPSDARKAMIRDELIQEDINMQELL